MGQSVVSPVLIGRQNEMALLAAGLRRAQRGEPVVALIGGEAGVGKTRLVSELASLAARANCTVLAGHCIELGAEGLPLAPLVDALRALSRETSAEELAEAIGPALPHLARILPGLAPDAAAWPAVGDVETGQLLELVLGLLERLSAIRPLVLVLEDLHWADQSTLELVTFLIRSLREVRLLLVITYRSDELHRRHPLRSLLAGWGRVRMVDRIELDRFRRDEVAAQLAAILTAEPGPGLTDLIFDRSDGNAYLVEELIGVVRRGGDPSKLPPSLADVLLSGVDSLSPATRGLLQTVSVAGRGVPGPLLARVAGLEEPALFAALREAVDGHQLVIDESGRGYVFRHALTRDAVYSDMLPAERVLVHAAYGEVLTENPELAGDDIAVPAALAHHWYAAQDLARALPASISAGQAMASYAPAEAQRHLERALEIWPRDPAARPNGLDQAELTCLAADAAYRAGALDRSLALFDRAVADMPAEQDPVRRALTMERRALVLRDMGRGAEAIAQLERALALLPPDPVSHGHAVILATLASALLRASEWKVAADAAQRAIAAARASMARKEEADASISLGSQRSYQEATEDGPEMLRSGLALALTLNVPVTALRGYVNLSDVLEFRGRHAEAAQVAREGLVLARRVGMTRMMGSLLAGNLAMSLLKLGQWAEADELVAQTLALAPEAVFVANLLLLRAERGAMSGRYGDSEADLGAARQALGETPEAQFVQHISYIAALLAIGREDRAAARPIIDEYLPQTLTGAARHAWPLLWLGTRIEADEAVLARDRGEPVSSQSRERSEVLAGWAAELVTMAVPAHGYRALIAAERARALGGDEPPHWMAAVAAFETAGEPYPLAYAWLRLAEVYAMAGQRSAAARAAMQAQVTAGRIGADPIAAEVAALARRARLTPDGLPGGDATAAEAPVDGLARFGLTSREREVLGVLAQGRSNREIARTLFISPKTVSVHVSSILAKLGVASRVQAATVAARLDQAERSGG